MSPLLVKRNPVKDTPFRGRTWFRFSIVGTDRVVRWPEKTICGDKGRTSKAEGFGKCLYVSAFARIRLTTA